MVPNNTLQIYVFYIFQCEISIKQLESEKERVDEKRDQLLKDQGRWRSKAEVCETMFWDLNNDTLAFSG